MSSPRRSHVFAGYRGRMLAVLALGAMAASGARLVVSPLLPTVIEELSITPSLAGLALTVMWAGFALAHYPGGRLADQLSRKTVLIGGLGLLTGGAALVATAPAYAAFVAGAAVFGVGAGLYPPAAFAYLSDLFEGRRGGAFGVISASNNLGGVVASGVATAALALAGWRAGFTPFVAVFGLVALALHLRQDDPYVLARPTLGARETGRRLADTGGLWPLLAAATLFAFTWQGATNFLPTFLQAEKGFSPTMASNAFAGLFVVGVAAAPAAGRLGDRFGYAVVAAAAAAVGAVGLTVVILGGSVPVIFAGIAVLASGLLGFWPLVNAALMATFAESSRGGDFGATRALYITVGSTGATYVGVVGEYRSYTLAFAGLVACAVATFAVAAWLARTRAYS